MYLPCNASIFAHFTNNARFCYTKQQKYYNQRTIINSHSSLTISLINNKTHNALDRTCCQKATYFILGVCLDRI